MLSELLVLGALAAGFGAPTPRDDLAARAKELGFPRSEQIARDALPGARLVAGGADTVGGARLGGDPDLPSAMSWPTCRGHRMSFLAQLPLADVAALAPGVLPASGGTLTVFADLIPNDDGVLRMENEGYGRVGNQTCVVVRTLRGQLARRATPKRAPKLRSRPVRLRPTLTVPDEEIAQQRYKFSDKQADAWFKLAREALAGTLGGPTDGLPRHQVLGWPLPIQSTPLYGCTGDSSKGLTHRLLLQLDYDSDLRFDFGDGGVLYLSGLPADLRAGRFGRLCAEFQEG